MIASAFSVFSKVQLQEPIRKLAGVAFWPQFFYDSCDDSAVSVYTIYEGFLHDWTSEFPVEENFRRMLNVLLENSRANLKAFNQITSAATLAAHGMHDCFSSFCSV